VVFSAKPLPRFKVGAGTSNGYFEDEIGQQLLSRGGFARLLNGQLL
jgi:hypothetical protein